MAEEKKNYMSMKDAELLEIMESYGLEKEDFSNDKGTLNRKSVCKMLKVLDVQIAAVAKKLEKAVAIDPEGEVVENIKTKKLHKSLSGMMVQLTFYNTDENDLPYVQMALNGIALIIPRERECWIPKEFMDGVLKNAITTRMKMVVDDKGGIYYEPKKVPRVTYTVHEMKHIDVLRKEYDEKKKRNN